jgi:hypothetical protein
LEVGIGIWDFFMNCTFHTDRLSIEACEVCQRPVCAECLWYAESGERLCVVHGELWQAQGKEVHRPQKYAQGIGFSQVSAANPPRQDVPYKGNSNDLNAFIALALGVSSLLACFGLWYVLPLFAFLLGLVAWLHARDSINPSRTRWMAGSAIASGGIFILIAFGFIMMCLMCYVLAIASSASSGGLFTPTPFRLMTPTP